MKLSARLSFCSLILLVACSAPSRRPVTSAAPSAVPTAVPRTVEDLIARDLADDDALLIGAGDIAECGAPLVHAEETAALIAKFPKATVFTTGDNAYKNGLKADFDNCYDPTWGSFKERTRPTPGNHDYGVYLKPPRNTADFYFDYFGTNAGTKGDGYYSYDLGGWHIVSLNSMADKPGAPTMSDQVAWLEDDLKHNDQRCILAYWHHPLYTSGVHGMDPADPGRYVGPLWDVLLRYKADVILNGHDHHYERFPIQDALGHPTPDGIREFLVGTGGGKLRAVVNPNPHFTPLDKDYGVLLMTLHANSYEWHFLKADETVGDSSSGVTECH